MKNKFEGLPALLLPAIPLIIAVISLLTEFNYLDLTYLILICVIFIKYKFEIRKQH